MSKPPLWDSVGRSGLMAGVALAIMLAATPAAFAQHILPADFFSLVPSGPADKMSVSADTMVFNSTNDTVVAQGNVGIRFQGFRATADRAVYHQATGRVELIGNVGFIDPEGVEYVADRVELEDGFREGFVEAFTAAFPDGSHFSAASTTFDESQGRVYNDGIYSPCGLCIDENGNRIGWTMKAARIITDEAEQVIYFEEPSLQLLGFTVIQLPWLALPSDEDIEMPVLSYDSKYGVGISLPFFNYRVAQGNLAITPTVYTSQGAGVRVDWNQRVGDLNYSISGSGVYQLNPGAYTGLGNRTVRGAIITSGRFTPADEWTLGWSYTAFTDPGFLPDYRNATATRTNEVFAQYLTADTFGDIRVEQFVPVGAFSSWAAHQNRADRQALTHPNARFDHVVDLNGAGRVELAGKLLGLSRAADHRSSLYSGNRYYYGYEGQSAHAMMQASWTNQYIVPGGLVVSPYLGLRGDAAAYDGASPNGPAEQSLLSATPIAALDVRYPLMLLAGSTTTVIEPIVQLVYRGGDALPGIVNNDSQTVVFEDTNLFSFNRFSGADRQETGLRANVGGQFQTSFDDGGWIGGLLGQSFQLAGTNSFNVVDGTPAGVGSGLNAAESYIVAGLQAGYGGVAAGAKGQFDPVTGEVPRLQASLSARADGYGVTADYVYIAENPTLGTTRDRHEVALGGTLPLTDYWSANGLVAWDLTANQWLEARAGIQYDDRFLVYGLQTKITGPTHREANDLRIGVNISLRRGDDTEVLGFGYNFSEF